MNDPAVLFYIGDWLKSTAELDADARGWYLNLLLHNYDKETLPSDLESLATLAIVKFSEFNRFEQVFKQVLNKKFEVLESGRITNPRINDILKSRESFVDKRSKAGKVSYMMKFFAKTYIKQYKNNKLNEFVKSNFDYDINLKNETEIKHMFEHLFELYLNENENENKVKDKGIDSTKELEFEKVWAMYKKKGTKSVAFDKFMKLPNDTVELIKKHVPKYINSVSELKYAKNFETYINQKHWESEIVINNTTPKQPEQKQLIQYHKPGEVLI